MASDTTNAVAVVADTTPDVSSKISLFKGFEVVIQIILAYFISVLSIWCAKKFGMTLDITTQAQLTAVGMAVVSGLLHGLYNYLTHAFPKVDVFKRFIA